MGVVMAVQLGAVRVTMARRIAVRCGPGERTIGELGAIERDTRRQAGRCCVAAERRCDIEIADFLGTAIATMLVVLAERVGRRRLRAQRNARRLAPQRTGCRPRSFALKLLPGTSALAAAVLLHDVRELMGKNELAAGRRQIHRSPLEMNVASARDGPSPRRHLGAVTMELDVIKPTAEHSLHPVLQRRR
jgi:hypothetical protein